MRILTAREQILPFLREWLELLAEGKYEGAFDLIHPSADEMWTPDILRQVIENYGDIEPRRDGKIFHITSLSAARVEENHVPYQDVEWFDEEKRQPGKPVGWVHFDLPLNGEMSDLTAIFDINEVEGGYVLQLESIDVL